MKKRIIILSLIFLIISINLVYSFVVSGTFSVERVNFCGDGIVAGNEECDLTNLSGQTCIFLNYNSGVLSCTSECTFNESLCNFVVPSGSAGGGGGSSGSGGGSSRSNQTGKITQCNDKLDNDNDGLIDYPQDPGCSNYLDDSEVDVICQSIWQCTNWTECLNGTKTQQCADINHCKVDYIKVDFKECSIFESGKLTSENFSKLFGSLWILPVILVVIVIIVIIYSLKRKHKSRIKIKKITKRKRHIKY